MASASITLSVAIVETCGAAFFEMHSLLERASQFRLRRFSIVGLARDPTTIFLHPAFAVACMTSFLSDPQCGLRWRFCFHWSATQARYVASSFDGLPCVPVPGCKACMDRSWMPERKCNRQLVVWRLPNESQMAA